MKYAIASIAANIVALACAVSATYLAANDKDGWGWFLIVAVATTVGVNWKDKAE